MYTSENYQKNKASIRAAQKKYYNKNKAMFCTKYKHHRTKWDAEHRAYLNEHARLNAQIRKLESMPYTKYIGYLLDNNHLIKTYLSDLHSRGLI